MFRDLKPEMYGTVSYPLIYVIEGNADMLRTLVKGTQTVIQEEWDPVRRRELLEGAAPHSK